MTKRIFVFALTQPIDGADKTFYEARLESRHAAETTGSTPSELAKNLQKHIQREREYQHDQENGGYGAFIVFRQPFDAYVTKEGKLSNLSPLGIMRHRSLNEEEIKEFLEALK